MNAKHTQSGEPSSNPVAILEHSSAQAYVNQETDGDNKIEAQAQPQPTGDEVGTLAK